MFVRDKRSKKWLALLSTDTYMADEEIVQTYKRRWDIEVFFKMAKSFLNLAKECQGRSYDALVAHATVVCCRYIMLALYWLVQACSLNHLLMFWLNLQD
ncbi:MAG: hypothetical protein AUK24_04155 [Syntrophaceae bacterium CG2_30_49_12]|nr:MAG: hypothetical protein AUK24_04155 [Syntrophaceae bacterium CG2_30_49_12]